MIKTKEKYRENIFNMRNNVYVAGEAVNRSDHRVMPGVRVMSTTFDMANDPKYKGVATATSSITGEEISRFVHLPQHPYDLMQKQKMIRVGARRVGGCIHRCMN